MNSDMPGGPPGRQLVDPVYLPFTEGQLRQHFKAEKHLDYYRNSARFRHAEHPPKSGSAIQMEKDERFWLITALKRLYDHRAESTALTTALESCLGDPPGDFGSWQDAMAEPLRLYFEAALPAPAKYRKYLKEKFRSLNLDLPSRRHPPARTRYEGQTWVDAVLVSGTGVAVLFEAKVLSDISCRIGYDATRNQIARTIDVMLDRNRDLDDEDGLLRAREPDLSFFVLLTPDLFRQQWQSRLYGWLMTKYKENPEVLQKHLAHRQEPDAVAAASKRIGWLTWEAIHDLTKSSPTGGLAWLEPQEVSASGDASCEYLAII